MTDLGANFYQKLVNVCSEVGMNPEDLLAVIISESGMNPAAHEKKYGASGLIQFMPATLKSVGYSGDPADFRELSGEKQLDYVKTYIKSQMPLNGGPFKSAAQYYIANFYPVALKLPGIKALDPSAAIVEENPEIVKDKTGQAWSKKYMDVGIKIYPGNETLAYKANPLFHGSVKGAITYGDLVRQVENNKRNPIYLKAVAQMKKETGYVPSEKSSVSSPESDDIKEHTKRYLSGIKGKESDVYNTLIPEGKEMPKQVENEESSDLDSKIDYYLKQIAANDKKLIKQLPKNNILLNVSGSDLNDKIEFSRVLCAALDERLFSRSYTHSSNNDVQIECEINGSKPYCFAAVKQFANALSEEFNKINNTSVNVNCYSDKKSDFEPITYNFAESNYRKFIFKKIKG